MLWCIRIFPDKNNVESIAVGVKMHKEERKLLEEYKIFADKCCDAANRLHVALDKKETLANVNNDVEKIYESIMHKLQNMFITPYDRRDMGLVCKKLFGLHIRIAHAEKGIRLFNAEENVAEIRIISGNIVRCCLAIKESIVMSANSYKDANIACLHRKTVSSLRENADIIMGIYYDTCAKAFDCRMRYTMEYVLREFDKCGCACEQALESIELMHINRT